MAQQRTKRITDTVRRRGVINKTWSSSILGGLAGGIVFGILMQSMGMMPTIASLYGLDGATMGWVAHLFHSIVFGLLFGGIVTMTRLRKYADRIAPTTGLGAVYGVLLWFVAATIVMPLWLGAVGMEMPPVPNFDPMSLVGHLVYGVVLGAVFAAAYRR
ncbi:hypothetical protein SAMN05421858_2560 [Haladaptatus litoreus]|uniref:Histidine kinase n=1 Tax=Haladaptatus litoreus TaxID=553468 RepID=A0A1N7BH77_9EURY|nr:hypothetical protein [Haladaptatus litoreus]SIR50751.1 hypothetical protein SAMN05421858_2560 [Haladaptatus litoreus]